MERWDIQQDSQNAVMTLIKVITYFTCDCVNHKVTGADPNIISIPSEIDTIMNSNSHKMNRKMSLNAILVCMSSIRNFKQCFETENCVYLPLSFLVVFADKCVRKYEVMRQNIVSLQ